MPTYKLRYFGIRGRGEEIRLIFAAAGVAFEDERIPKEEWATVKPTTPWGQIPVLEVDGKPLSQSVTICRYLARKFKLNGADEWESTKCEEHVDANVDLFNEFVRFYFEADEARKAKAKETFVGTSVPNYLKKLQAFKEANGGDFLVGKQLTWADIYIADKLDRLLGFIKPEAWTEYPAIKKWKDGIFNQPKLKEYIAARPESAI